ncbi:pyridoxal-phosphate dependent enzyme [Lacibacter sediminis]|uniref:Pyridoxal-phosphate dependent enzyme n=1 Tax=Lacibacter sediminis TaxID=2760713 RepID=A0A7G5XMD2_9BACT|nr:pyridoxal-phosphate dependent enzyme [Lacibacter sediminis]QNA46635.1 pyridoxal-phosphate dependent enzyme [Lacibacter sediminis]
MSISKEQIEQAHERIKPFIHKTAVLTCNTINELAGAELFFKCENFQKIGAFKIRGGMNAALSLSKEKAVNGIATHSSGNHAQAIAYAARQLGTKAYIVMPNNSPSVKVNAVKGYGAEVTFCENNQQAREETLQAIVDRTGAEFIHPYNDDRVITGQATCAKELLEEIPSLDFLLAPVGGGGLLSGTLLSAHYFSPETKVYAGEPEGAADAVLSLKSGKIETAPYIKTIADGLLTKLGDKTFPIIQQYVADILTVSDEEIISTLRLVYERMKIIVEPSCVVPLAALLKNKELFAGKRAGIILSGGNVDLKKFCEWFS